MSTEVDPTLCPTPGCAKPNNCALANGGTQCWCMVLPVGKINPAALALVPPEAKNKACLCQACATAQPEPAK